jgi:serine O-acetyltransferase
LFAELTEDLDSYAYRLGIPKRKCILVILLYPTCWPIIVYRFGNHIYKSKRLNKIFFPLYFFLKRFTEIATKIEISEKATIGGGIFISHYGSIVIGSGSVIGKNLSIHQGCTIGGDGKGSPYPVIGDNCYMGVNSVIVGNVTIGNNVVIGGGSIVVTSFPNDVTIGGNPAKKISEKGSKDYIQYRNDDGIIIK